MEYGKYINREISWLEFNSRVLDEAADEGNQLLERLKFLAIFSSNLDEFFMVRIADMMQQTETNPGDPEPVLLLNELRAKVRSLVATQYKCLNDDIIPALAQNGIVFKNFETLDTDRKALMRKYFLEQIHPVLTPIGIDQSHPFPLIKNTGLEMLVKLTKEGETEERFAIIEIPSILSRFITVEKQPGRQLYLPVGNLISHNLDILLSGCVVKEVSYFRITRDMDFILDEDRVNDMLYEMQQELRKTTKRRVIRLEISDKMSEASRKWLQEKLSVPDDNVYIIPGFIDLRSLFEIAGNKNFPDLKDKELQPLASIHINEKESMFDAISRNGSFIVHHPYESFAPVVRMIEEAANDPNVLAIKQTLYRVGGGESPIVRALIKAALNRKQVTVLFELKARFDEENNIVWARELAEAGAHVVYGIAGLKVHCKVLLIVRKEANGINRYIHLSSGNYNDKTAKVYTDIGYFSNDKILANDVSALFNVITGFSRPPAWDRLFVAPFNLRDRLEFLINREATLSTKENPGHIIIKANAVIDPQMIDCLYEAARKHVKIDMLVRGACSVNPYSLKKGSENFRIVSVLDRFLEHSRIYYFKNNGASEYYVGSADLMPRNLDRRIEALFPIDKPEIRKELDMIISAGFNDKRKGRKMIAPNSYSSTINAQKHEKTRSQQTLYNFYKERCKTVAEQNKSELEIKVFTDPAL